ncbi:hypothetical protein [Streptomyces sp. NPDC004250]|uniref:hypothetical protein n=1 Tax=Streptomyces sp. NPDC004250 TaxID=3364692 RepID=UPI0036C5BA3B
MEAWLYDPDETPDHRDGVRYLSTRASRAEAIADLAHWRSACGAVEDDPSPVYAVVADEQFDRFGPGLSEEQSHKLFTGSLAAYGVGALRAFAPPHARRGQFYADLGTFTWGLIAPSGLEGIYTRAAPKTSFQLA